MTQNDDSFNNAIQSIICEVPDLSKEDVDKWTKVMKECNEILQINSINRSEFIELFNKVNTYSLKNDIEEKTDETKEQSVAMNVKLLFLDVDGVINTSSMWPGQMVPLSDEHIKRIGMIIKATQCKIVLTTTWRYMKNKRKKLIQKLNEIGDEIGIKFDVIGRTPYNSKKKLPLTQRSKEIKQYIDKVVNEGTYNIVSWCAVDDMDLTAKAHQWHKECNEIIKGHFVKTNESVGITDKDTQKVIAILNAT